MNKFVIICLSVFLVTLSGCDRSNVRPTKVETKYIYPPMPEACPDPWAPIVFIRDVHTQLSAFEQAFYECSAKVDGVRAYIRDQKENLSPDP